MFTNIYYNADNKSTINNNLHGLHNTYMDKWRARYMCSQRWSKLLLMKYEFHAFHAFDANNRKFGTLW